MKINPPLRHAPAAVFALAILALTSQMGFAQTAREAAEKNREVLDQAVIGAKVSKGAIPGIIITDGMLDRNGKKQEATLENVIELVRERHPQANIVLSPRLHTIRISDLKLRAASLEQELEALRVASGYKFFWNNGAGVPLIDPATGLPVGAPFDGTPAGDAPLYVLSEAPNALDGRRVEVFNLSAFIQRLDSQEKKDVDASLRELQDIIFSTLRDQGNAPEQDLPRFNFHSGANLLIVTGSEASLDVARKVIGAMGGQTASPPRGGGRSFGGSGGFEGGNLFANPFEHSAVPGAVTVPMSKARRSINNKLESIRLDSFVSDNLPLSEVVNHLREEARRRDPEKQGVNFLISPNPLVIYGRAPQQVPINSIAIRLSPALNNVRLVDALDAIVKVADRSIQYSIMDYGVVFAAASSRVDPLPVPPQEKP